MPSKKLATLAAVPLVGLACAGSAHKHAQHPQQDVAVSAEAEPKKEIVYLPGYEVRRKIAVLLDGTELAPYVVEDLIKDFQEKGFEKVFVASDESMPEDSDIQHFPGTTKGFNNLFTMLRDGKELKKDDLLFVYVHGHGTAKNGESCIAITRQRCYTQKRLLEQLKFVKEARARLLFFSDGCRSGSFPDALMNAGFEGAAMTAAKYKEAGFHSFMSRFQASFHEEYDRNADGISEPSDWFLSARAAAQSEKQLDEEYGEYSESHPELSLENLDTILKLNKEIIIEIITSGCESCNEAILKQISISNGTQVKVVTLTHGVNKDFDAIVKRLGITEKIDSFPRIYIKKHGENEFSRQEDNYLKELVKPKGGEEEVRARMIVAPENQLDLMGTSLNIGTYFAIYNRRGKIYSKLGVENGGLLQIGQAENGRGTPLIFNTRGILELGVFPWHPSLFSFKVVAARNFQAENTSIGAYAGMSQLMHDSPLAFDVGLGSAFVAEKNGNLSFTPGFNLAIGFQTPAFGRGYIDSSDSAK